jgi:hypothetical protein
MKLLERWRTDVAWEAECRRRWAAEYARSPILTDFLYPFSRLEALCWFWSRLWRVLRGRHFEWKKMEAGE